MARAERLRRRHVFFAADHDARRTGRVQQRRQGRVRVGPERGSAHFAAHGEGNVGAREGLELGRAPIVEQRANGQDAEHLGALEAQRDRHADHFQHAFRMQPERRRELGIQRHGRVLRDVRDGARDGFANQCELLTASPMDQEQIRTGLHSVIGRDRLGGRPVGELDHRLELRQIGDQPRRARDIFELRVPLIVDERGRFREVAVQFGFSLRGQARADQIHRGADRQHGQQGAGQEDAVGDRAEDAHQGTTRSISAQPPGGTLTGRVTRASPSYQPTRV